MRILLFISSIYKTLDNGSSEEFNNLIEKIEKLKNFSKDDIVLISICDNTENKDVISSYLTKFRNKDFFMGEQFSGNLHYMSEYGGSILYEKGIFDKPTEIIKYVKKLQNEGFEIDLVICDGNMNINEYKNKIENELDCSCIYIYSINSISDINIYIDEICVYKKLNYFKK